MSARDLTFHMKIPWGGIFLLVLDLYFDLDFWPSRNKILQLPFCMWLFLVIASFNWYQNICPWDLGDIWSWPLWGHLYFTNTSCLFLLLLYFHRKTVCIYKKKIKKTLIIVMFLLFGKASDKVSTSDLDNGQFSSDNVKFKTFSCW